MTPPVFKRLSDTSLPSPKGEHLLKVERLAANQALEVKIDGLATPARNFSLVYDLLAPKAGMQGNFASLLQLGAAGASDGDLFLKNTSGGIQVGIDNKYSGTLTADTWHRLVVTLADNGDGTSTLSRYANGTLLGSQKVPGDRFSLDNAQGLRLFNDEDGETWGLDLAAFAVVARTLTSSEITALGGAASTAVLTDKEAAPHAEFSFAGGSLAATRGAGTLKLIGEGTPAKVVPMATAGQVRLPDQDLTIMSVGATKGLENGLVIRTDAKVPVKNFTLSFDLLVEKTDGMNKFGSLFQVDMKGDGETFLRSDGATFSIGHGGKYSGTLEFGAWHRVTVTVTEGDAGKSVLTYFANGKKLGTATVDTARATIDPKLGLTLFNDDDGETWPLHVSSVTFAEVAAPADYVESLGGVSLNGPADMSGQGFNFVQFGFDKGDLSATAGKGSLKPYGTPDDTNPGGGGGTAPVDLKIIAPLADSLIKVGSADKAIDLTKVFAGKDLSYKVTTSDGAVVDAKIDAKGVMTLDFGKLGVSDLSITATDSTGKSVTDNVRYLVTGDKAYTIAVFPDTQDYTDDPMGAQVFKSMTKWIADNAGNQNIQFLAGVGDITQWDAEGQYAIVKQALANIDGKVPFLLPPGNHDGGGHSREYINYNKFFDLTKIKAESKTFGGVYDREPNSYQNNYHTFTAPDGQKWLVMGLEFGPRDDVLRWADDVLKSHPDHRAILTTHAYTNWDGIHDPLGKPLNDEGAGHDYAVRTDPGDANDGETMWRDVVTKNPNVVFTFSGHIFGDGAETTIRYNDFGGTVYNMLMNYQDGVSKEITGAGNEAKGGNGGNGAIRLITIDPENDTFYTGTYFTELDTYLTGGRGGMTLDRNGLKGPYVGHQEVYRDAGVSGDMLVAGRADAGADQTVDAGGKDKVAVTLDGSASKAPAGGSLAYEWRDADGKLVGTGAQTPVELASGRHQFTLTTRDGNGKTHDDTVQVFVKGKDTLLIDTFNDGNLNGWSKLDALGNSLPQLVAGKPADFNLPDLAGGTATIAKVPSLPKSTGLLVVPQGTPADGGAKFDAFTLIYDVFLAKGGGAFTSLFQGDTSNSSDGDIFIKETGGDAYGIGIGGNYPGGISLGAWHRLTFTIEGDKMVKYADGVMVGEQSIGNDRYAFDPKKGFLLFADEDGETNDIFISSFTFTEKVLTKDAVAALGGPDAKGPVLAAGDPNAFQIDFGGSGNSLSFGNASVAITRLQDTGWLVKGSVYNNPNNPYSDGSLFDQTNSPDAKMLIWGASEAKAWTDYSFEVSINSYDDDAVGVLFRVKDASNHYMLTLDTQKNERVLVKVQDGVTTELAREANGYRFYDEMRVKVAVVGDEIRASIDGEVLFGGPVKDTKPLVSGTIGVISRDQTITEFDDVVVTRAVLTADAGEAIRVVDFDGDGKVSVALDGANSFGPSGIASYDWSAGTASASGKSATLDLAAGKHDVRLTVKEAGGKSSSDLVKVEVVSKDRVLIHDTFSDGNMDGWTVKDTGDLGGASDWKVDGGRLVQAGGITSKELTWKGASATDVWERGWSPLGDGIYALHQGTAALWQDGYSWTDYSVAAKLVAPAKGGMGFMLRYQDANNYYKLEVDAKNGLTTLVKMVNGRESFIDRARNTYTPGETVDLRVDVQGTKFSVWLNGLNLFPDVAEDRSIASGTVGLYTWGNPGVTFDDVTVLSLKASTGSNQAPDLLLSAKALTLAEGTVAADRVLADVSVKDDGIGTNVISVSDSRFAVENGKLVLKAASVLDFEAGSTIAVKVSVDDASIGTGPEDIETFTLTLTDVAEGGNGGGGNGGGGNGGGNGGGSTDPVTPNLPAPGGSDSNDTLTYTTTLPQQIDGKGGFDTVRLPLAFDAVKIVAADGGFRLEPVKAGQFSPIFVANIEAVEFLGGVTVPNDPGAIRRVALDSSKEAAAVHRLYDAAFNRDPDTAGLTHWAKMLKGGESLSSVAEMFAGSPEFTRGQSLTDDTFVARVYENAFGRKPDAAGLAHWVKQLQGGASRGEILVAISESQEHVNNQASAVKNGVWTLSEGVEHRGTAGADTIRVASLPARVDGGAGTDKVVFTANFADVKILSADKGFEVIGTRGGQSASVSNVEHLVFGDGTELKLDTSATSAKLVRLFDAAFDRPGDIAGLSGWAKALSEGKASLGSIADAFVKSAEFASRFGANLSDAAFVQAVYENAFGRSAEPAGLAGWVKAMGEGKSRGDVLTAIAESAEHVQLTGNVTDDGVWLMVA
ncbi:DUF4214 domain-containing protein [Pannonibacter tanglangensis]|uniref:DUF4214 domain-containing protein n=1 Tax=Pannonibacter tanglangensis TaxID=2750084 RepID=A0ABW9ZIE2_9HYPH|nr:DUF4214 domain-containing protein [Pannonibacter sp. XCT-34]NBN64624.1 DUF4214 domain-containing protein [Pannonibacter sp. XCT-34]